MVEVVDKVQFKYGLPLKSLSTATRNPTKTFKPHGHLVPLPNLFLSKVHIDKKEISDENFETVERKYSLSYQSL